MTGNPVQRCLQATLTTLAILGGSTGLVGQIVDPIRETPNAQEQARREALRERLRIEQEQRRREDQMMFPFSAAPRGAPLPFHLGYSAGLKQLFPTYEGLPTYPSNVPGYGGYPGAANAPGDKAGPPQVRVPGAKVPDEVGRWPSWIEGGVKKKGERASARQSVLVRVADRVWLRESGEPAFVPLAHYDRFRFLEAGGQIEVRGKGEFQIVMHDGGSIRSRGPCSLSVTALNDKLADLRVDNVQNLWVSAKVRPVRVRLPDGTIVTFTASLLHLERRGDRVRVANVGSGPIRYQGTAGNGSLVGPVYISTWTKEPTRLAETEPLQVEGRITRSKTGDAITLSGGEDGRVVWSGAAFALPAGATLTVQPLSAPNPREAGR